MNNQKTIRVLGIDPGLNVTGYGVIDFDGFKGVSVVEAGVLRGGSSKVEIGDRLSALHLRMNDVLESLKPDVVAVEKLFSHYERPQTAILMGHARGVLYLAAVLANLPVHSYAATQVKSVLTGNGRAPKTQMQDAVTRQLGLEEVPEPADVADALAIAMCHCFLSTGKQAML